MEYLSLGRTRGWAGFLFEKRPSNAICNRGCFFYSPIHFDNTTFYLQLLILSICIYNNLDRARRPPNNTRLTNQETGSFSWKYKNIKMLLLCFREQLPNVMNFPKILFEYTRFFYKNLFYKNVEAVIYQNFKNMLRTCPRLRVRKRLYFTHLG